MPGERFALGLIAAVAERQHLCTDEVLLVDTRLGSTLVDEHGDALTMQDGLMALAAFVTQGGQSWAWESEADHLLAWAVFDSGGYFRATGEPTVETLLRCLVGAGFIDKRIVQDKGDRTILVRPSKRWRSFACAAVAPQALRGVA